MEVTVGPGQLIGIGAVHADVSFMVQIEIAANSDDVFRAPRVERQVETDICDKIIEALLSVEGSSRKGESQGARVLDSEGE